MGHIFGNDKKTTMTMPQMSSLPVIKCSKCGSVFFENAFLIRVLYSVASPDGQEHIIPEPVFVCKSCGTVLGVAGDEQDIESEEESENTKESLLDIEEEGDKPSLKLV